jgi:hypothetical protein
MDSSRRRWLRTRQQRPKRAIERLTLQTSFDRGKIGAFRWNIHLDVTLGAKLAEATMPRRLNFFDAITGGNFEVAERPKDMARFAVIQREAVLLTIDFRRIRDRKLVWRWRKESKPYR